jgi:hypothetical protein
MISRSHCLFAVLALCLTCGHARGQDAQPGAQPPATPGAAPVSESEKKYVEMSHSKDRVLKATAERYLNVIKLQEWAGASGKSLMAKYVSHDPDLAKVKLAVATGTGKDRVFKDYDVAVDKLSKTCQARVKQIDVLQKRLDELSAAVDSAGKSGGPAGPGSATASERGMRARTAQGPEGPAVSASAPGSTPAQPAAAPAGPEADPSASEPDPLGFGDLPAAAPPAAAPPQAGPGGVLPGAPPTAPAGGPAPVPAKTRSADERKQWRTNLALFAANISVATDPTGKPTVDWGELKELREINDILVAQQGPMPPARSPEAESPAAISERIGDVHWQIVVDKVENAPGGLVIPSFHPIELAKPVEFHIALDDAEDLQKWAKLPPNAAVGVTARLSITEPYKITAKVKLADAK